MKRSLLFYFLLTTAAALRAGVPPGLEDIEDRFDFKKVATNESTRSQYVHEVADLAQSLAEKELWHQWKMVARELAKHPAPAGDATHFRSLLIGAWEGSRHTHVYQADGSWQLAASEQGSLHGTWKISGNQFLLTYLEPTQTTTATIILIDERYFITSDSRGRVFIATRNSRP